MQKKNNVLCRNKLVQNKKRFMKKANFIAYQVFNFEIILRLKMSGSN